MARIKSALELALEKTEDIKGDKTAIQAHEKKQEGKQIASRFLSPDRKKDEISIIKMVKSYPKNEQQWVREGIVEILLANLGLPKEESEIESLEKLKEGFLELISDKKRTEYYFQQLKQFYSQYLQDRERVTENLKQQYGPQFQRKQEEIKRQTGGSVQMSMEQDPEFASYLNKHLGQVEEQYKNVLYQIKEDLKKMALT